MDDVFGDGLLQEMASDIASVRGIVGVTLGGSRARGTHRPDSDVDLGLYRRGTVDLTALQACADRWSLTPAPVTAPGGWGPWVDGGAWLRVALPDRTELPDRTAPTAVPTPVAVDWIHRDLDRVHAQWERAQRGEFAFHEQPGHPLGFLDVAYVGELATSRTLADNHGELAELRRSMSYPPALAEALDAAAWQAGFLIDGAAKTLSRPDLTWLSLCLAKAFALCAHALHARNHVWVTNEKGLVPAAGRLPDAPPEFAERCGAALSGLTNDPAGLASALASAKLLVAEVIG